MAETTLAGRITSLRKEAGLTQEQLAEQSGFSLRSIRSWEQGTREPAPAHVSVLATCLGTNTAVLLGAPGDTVPAVSVTRAATDTVLLTQREPAADILDALVSMQSVLVTRLDALERSILAALPVSAVSVTRDEAEADSDGQVPARPRQQVVYAHPPVNAHTSPSCIAGLPYKKPMKRIGEL